MNTWYYIKNWFNKPKVKPTLTRKKRNNETLSKAQVRKIQSIHKNKHKFDVSTLDDLRVYCNKELAINKSRSVYGRIVKQQGAYAPITEG